LDLDRVPFRSGSIQRGVWEGVGSGYSANRSTPQGAPGGRVNQPAVQANSCHAHVARARPRDTSQGPWVKDTRLRPRTARVDSYRRPTMRYTIPSRSDHARLLASIAGGAHCPLIPGLYGKPLRSIERQSPYCP